MRTYTIDLDLFKIVAAHAIDLQWRVSSSGLGLHLRWQCPHKYSCCICDNFRNHYDDPKRRKMEKQRTSRRSGVLYDQKGNRKSGKWVKVTLPKD